jgi:AcrR family transcriptional regulator
MCPRPYRLGQRQATAEKTRARIIAAARALIVADTGFVGFTVDAVAKQAGVARMTVYYQFGSKVGILEGLCDSLACHGGLEQLCGVFANPDALAALSELIVVFCRFWDSDRLLARRLHGLAALDPDFEQVLRNRQGRRREGLNVIVGRLAAKHKKLARQGREELVDMLYALTCFETFDALSGTTRTAEEVAALMQRMVRTVLGLDEH